LGARASFQKEKHEMMAASLRAGLFSTRPFYHLGGLGGLGPRALSSRGAAITPRAEEVEARDKAVRKLIAQREELTQGRLRRRHFTPIEPGEQITSKILEYEATARANGMYKVAFKGDSRHTKRSVQRVREANAGKWRAFKAQLNDSLAILLENRR
jgi:hypothetical protein